MQAIGTTAALPAGAMALYVGGHAALARFFGARGGTVERLAAAALFAVAAPIAIVVVLGRLALLTPYAIAAATFAIAIAAWTAAGARGRAITRGDLVDAVVIVRAALLGGTWSFAALAGVIGVLLAAVAAWLLPVWAWDALGYHLPVVYDALLSERLRVVPTHVPYVNAYPHAVDLYFVWWRALLPDDTWIELAQLPFALLAVLSATALCARAGVAPGRSLGWCMAFLAIPAVTLQLATNYVDIAYGALLVTSVVMLCRSPFERGDAILAGVALALFLGAKPSAPLPFAVIIAAAAFRHRRRVGHVAIVIGVASAFGAINYLENLLRHGNPVWPVQLRLGPVTMPGLMPSTYFFDLGVPEPYRSYGALRRMFVSWYHWPRSFVYDMRLGGFGPAVGLVLIPVALALVLLRRRALRPIAGTLVLLSAASLATPAAFWARYTLAFPLALLVLCAVGTRTARATSRRALEASIAVAVAIGLFAAAPGLTEGRMSLAALAALPSDDDRAALFGGIDGAEEDWIQLHERRGSGGAVAYDQSLGLPARLWDGIGAARIVYVGAAPDADLPAMIEREGIDTAVLGERTARALSRAGLRLEPLFVCSIEPCTVYRVHAGSTTKVTSR